MLLTTDAPQTSLSLERAWTDLIDLAAGRADPARSSPAWHLWDLYAPIAQARGPTPFVIGQLGQSLDGRVATASGKSRYINGPEGIAHLHRLRALVDAVVVGIGTVIADDPQLSVREVPGPSPARFVIDPNFRLPASARLMQGGGPIFAIQGRAGGRPDGVTPIVVAMDDGVITPASIVAALAGLGLRRILIEGGARTVSSFLAAGALDRLHVSVAPMIIGSGPIGLNLPPIDELDAALRPSAQIYKLGEDLVFDCVFKA